MTLRTHRLRVVARQLNRIRLWTSIGDPWMADRWAQEIDDRDDDDEFHERDRTCSHCSGTGGDPWNDGITPCEHCDGEGYEWWN